MKFKKTFVSELVSSILATIGYCYIKLVFYTTKWQIIYSAPKELYNHKSVIYAFWHGRLTLMPCFTLNRSKTNVLISNHRDGKVITKIMKFFNFAIINTRKNNFQALKTVFTKLSSGENIAITPDSAGRRGPRMKVGGNIINIAKKSNIIIIPASFSLRRNIILKSWDRFLFPIPFSRGVFIYGEPIHVLQDQHPEQKYKILLEDELNRITNQADKILNLPVVMPENDIL